MMMIEWSAVIQLYLLIDYNSSLPLYIAQTTLVGSVPRCKAQRSVDRSGREAKAAVDRWTGPRD